MFIKKWILLLTLGLLTACDVAPKDISAKSAPEVNAILSSPSIFTPVIARHGMVVTEEEIASRIGADILRRGGNAVDAAVAVGFTLAVVLPRAGNLGGGGFMLVHLAKTNKTIAIDYREMAPGRAHRDMYLGEDGEVDKDRKRYSYLAAGVPGSVAGLCYALETYGTMSLDEVLSPAIKLAEEGFILKPVAAATMKKLRPRFLKCEASRAIFLKKGDGVYEFGDRLIQKDLAWSLRQIQEHGADAFYKGAIAKRFVADMQKHGGWITKKDLARYEPKERAVVRGQYRGYEIMSMPPPSSGGIHLVQMLNILEGYPLAGWGQGSANSIHVMAEAMKLAYADRSKYLGDPDFVNVPVRGITSKAYATKLRKRISLNRATPSLKIGPHDPMPYESPQTTHFSVMDKHGNAVSNTYTLNFSYGSGITIAGTGILLNNEMDDFSGKPGTANAYGLLGGEANAVAGYKRPLSSMTPTIVLKEGRVFLVTGSPGGSRIITTVLQSISNVIDHRMNILDAICAPRMHHQWWPDTLRVERGICFHTIAQLHARGHNVKVQGLLGCVQAIMWDGKIFYGGSDPRRNSGRAVGY